MADLWFNVDAALSEVPINIMPLIDDTDFKTREESVVYNQAGLDLLWNFVTTAGAYTQTAVTPTDTAGDYDWVNQGNGYYTIEIPASGGASINNDTEGFGWFSGFATGILPWRGPVIGFRAAALNDALIDGGDNLDVNVTQWLGTAAATPTVAGVPEVDLTHIAGATTNVSALATNVAAVLADTSTDGVVVAAASKTGYSISGTKTTLDALNDVSAATVNAQADQALADYDGPTNAEMEARTLVAASYATASALTTVDTVVDAIKAKTDNLPSGVAKNVALSGFPFLMVDATDFATPETGLTVTAEISQDGAAFASATNSPAEVANGIYTIDLTQAEMNADTLVLKFTATGAAQRTVVLVTDA